MAWRISRFSRQYSTRDTRAWHAMDYILSCICSISCLVSGSCRLPPAVVGLPMFICFLVVAGGLLLSFDFDLGFWFSFFMEVFDFGCLNGEIGLCCTSVFLFEDPSDCLRLRSWPPGLTSAAAFVYGCSGLAPAFWAAVVVFLPFLLWFCLTLLFGCACTAVSFSFI